MSGAMMAMIGGRSGTITSPFTNWAVQRLTSDPVPSTATITFGTNGTVTSNDNNGGSTGSNWWSITPQGGIGASYYVRLTPTVGSFTANDASSFVLMSSDRVATRVRNTVGSTSVTFTIEIATDAGGSNIVLTSSGNTLTATQDP